MSQLQKTLSFVLITVIFTVSQVGQASPFQADSEAPLIYYYSSLSQAFIIERADGTNSQILTSFTPPPAWDSENSQPMVVVGPGWSPSGNWLAWTTDLPYGNRGQGQNVYLAHRSGGDWQSVFDAEGAWRIHSLTWSPTDDQLLIQRLSNEDDSEQVIVYDVKTQEMVLILDAKELGAVFKDQARFVGVEWTPDGQAVSLSYYRQCLSSGQVQALLQIISLDGTQAEREIFLPDPDHECYRLAPRIHPSWSSTGRILYTAHNGEDFVVEDLTGAQFSVPIPTPFVYHVDWNPGGSDAFVYTIGDCRMYGDFSLWRLSVSTRSLSRLPEDAAVFVQPAYQLEQFPYPTSIWSPTGEFGAFFSENHSQLYLLDAESSVLKVIVLAAPYSLNDPLRWTDDGTALLFSYRTPEDTYQVHSYDVVSGKTTILAPANCEHFSSLRTPHLFCSTTRIPGYAYHTDTVSGVQTQLPFMDTEYESDIWLHIYTAIWHPEQPWFFWMAHVDVGGGDMPWRMTIANPDFSGYRELGHCFPEQLSCYGWLP